MDHQNELLGLLHGCYGLGATISPLVVTTMVTKDGVGWWTFYYLMVGLVAVEICVGITAFWTETGTKYRDRNRTDGEEKGMTRIALRQKVTWICSVFFLAYVGTEGQWIWRRLQRSPIQTDELTLYRSIPRWVDRDLHATDPPRPTFPFRHDSHRFLAWYYHGTRHPWLHHTTHRRRLSCQHLPHCCHGSRAYILAGASISCLRCRRFPHRLLHWANVPGWNRCCDKAAAEGTPCRRDWICCCRRGRRCGSAAFCCWSNSTGEGRADSAAYSTGAAGSIIGNLAVLATYSQA